MIASAISSMCAALGANGPSRQLAAPDVFGWLVGAWELEILDSESAGTYRVTEGEWHFAWVLEGRAIQDVLIAPRLSQRRNGIPLNGNRYGTGLRVSIADRWRALWVDPMQGKIETLAVEPQGREIVESADGSRNTFFDIAKDQFRYRLESSRNGGSALTKVAEFLARRVS